MAVQVSRNTKTFEKKQVLKKSLQGLLLCSWYTIHHLSHRHFQYNTELFFFLHTLFLYSFWEFFPQRTLMMSANSFVLNSSIFYFLSSESSTIQQSFVTTNQKRLNQTDKSFQKMLMFFSASFSNFSLLHGHVEKT